ncbi:MAG: hypothetical protein HY369_01280 [Candidatus Aenigmarchaeota archaeon]|nr:hypothetical protein [Candidatus Aenigmarchaeota archaeon]
MSTPLPSPTTTAVQALSFGPYTFARVLREAERVLGPVTWNAVNEQQAALLALLAAIPDARHAAIPEIEVTASEDVQAVNRFLRDHGFGIQLDKQSCPDDQTGWYAASVLDLLVRWLIIGRPVTITLRGTDRQFPGVALKEGVSVRLAEGLSSPVAVIETQSADTAVFLTIPPAPPATPFELHTMIEDILSRRPRLDPDLRGVHVPMVDYHVTENLAWLERMQAPMNDGRIAVILQALREARVRLNLEGAHVKEAVALGGVRLGAPMNPRPPLVIDRPFLFWIERRGIRAPLFEAYLTPDCWKDPGTL